MIMSLLKSVIKATSPSAPKGIIYGPPGIGKSTYVANAGESIVIDIENGAGTIQCTRTPHLQTWREIETWLTELATTDHGYNAVAIDTLDWLFRRIEEHVSGCLNDTDSTLSRSHGGYGNGKQVMKNYVYQVLLPLLDNIVNSGVAVIMLAHSRRTDITDADGITVEKTAPALPVEYLEIVTEWADFICLARKNAKGERELITEETSRALAKNRYNLPPTIGFTWDEFTTAMMQGLGLEEKKTVKKETK